MNDAKQNITIDLSQRNINNKIIAYLEFLAQEELSETKDSTTIAKIRELQQLFSQGCCYAFALIFAEMNAIGTAKWWLGILSNIASWNNRKENLDKTAIHNITIHGRQLTLREQLHLVANYLLLYQYRMFGSNYELPKSKNTTIELDQKSLFKHNLGHLYRLDSTTHSPKFKFPGRFNSELLEQLLRPLTTATGPCCLINSRPPYRNHVMAVSPYNDKSSWVYYDSNDRRGSIIFKDLTAVFKQVQLTLKGPKFVDSDDEIPICITIVPLEQKNQNLARKIQAEYKVLITEEPDFMLENEVIEQIITERRQNDILQIFGLSLEPEAKQTTESREELAAALIKPIGNYIGCGLHLLAQLSPKSVVPIIAAICKLPDLKGQRALLTALTFTGESNYSGLMQLASTETIDAFNYALAKIFELPNLEGQKALLELFVAGFTLSEIAHYVPKFIPIIFNELFKLETLGVDVRTQLAIALTNSDIFLGTALHFIVQNNPQYLALFMTPDKPEDLPLVLPKIIPQIFHCDNLTGQRALYMTLFAPDQKGTRFSDIVINTGKWLKDIITELLKLNNPQFINYLTLAITTQNGTNNNGLHNLALYAPNSLETVATAICNSQGQRGREALLIALQQKNNEGLSGADYVGQYASKSCCRRILSILRKIPTSQRSNNFEKILQPLLDKSEIYGNYFAFMEYKEPSAASADDQPLKSSPSL